MKKKRIFWIVIIFTFFLCGMKCEAKERTLYRDKAQLFQKTRKSIWRLMIVMRLCCFHREEALTLLRRPI